ncbi:hypothetical protein DdX_06045 [Ditylenchus destructor]|uniref:Uncharacterized protein n=1 Tax=Ditylenchus destructor TaxID=166010 RepID=A0AAD4R9F6_9BILA|nr:hypothetical protein DdX_06045 [Ditylenchus destructor]
MKTEGLLTFRVGWTDGGATIKLGTQGLPRYNTTTHHGFIAVASDFGGRNFVKILESRRSREFWTFDGKESRIIAVGRKQEKVK